MIENLRLVREALSFTGKKEVPMLIIELCFYPPGAKRLPSTSTATMSAAVRREGSIFLARKLCFPYAFRSRASATPWSALSLTMPL